VRPRSYRRIKSLGMGRADEPPGTPNHSLYHPALLSTLCYPEGNFGGNQLLNDSIGLSPLYSSLTNDLHVSTAYGLPPRFLLASTYSSIARRFSGPNITRSNSAKAPEGRVGEQCEPGIAPTLVLLSPELRRDGFLGPPDLRVR